MCYYDLKLYELKNMINNNMKYLGTPTYLNLFVFSIFLFWIIEILYGNFIRLPNNGKFNLKLLLLILIHII